VIPKASILVVTRVIARYHLRSLCLAEEPGAMPAAATAAPDSRITMAAMKGFPERLYLEITS
jgi:hypothetical protein